MEKAEKIYSSLEEACTKGNFANVEQFLTELEGLIEESVTVNEIYTKAVVKALDTFKGKFSSTKVKKFIAAVSDLVGKNPKDKKLKNHFAKALRSSLIAMKTKGQPNVMKELMTDLESLAESEPDNIVVHEELSIASHELVHYWRNRGDFKALRERTQKFRKLVEKFPDNEQIKLNLTKSLTHEINSSRKTDITKIDTILSEIQMLSESMPTNVGLQLEWIHAYRTAMDRGEEKPEDAKRWLESMKKIAQNKKEEGFKLELARGYLNAISTLGEQNMKQLTKHLDELEMLADTSKDSLELQTIYAESLFTSLKIVRISNLTETYDIIDELRELNEAYPKNKTITQLYIEALLGIISLLAQEKKAKEIIPLVEQFEKLDERYPKDEFIQGTYDQLMGNLDVLGFKKKSKKKPRLDYM